MSTVDGTVVVMTKAPVAGRSKTRLCPPLSPTQAADVARAALADTFAAVGGSNASRAVVALEGEVGPWLPADLEVIAQRGGGLDERLAHAFEDVGERAVIIAMDTPQVTSALLDDALGRLSTVDAVLGPTADGGYWTIGLADPQQDVIRGIPMSSAETWGAQVRRFEAAGLRWERLAELVDVDNIDDARLVARAIPDSRFGRLVRSLIE